MSKINHRSVFHNWYDHKYRKAAFICPGGIISKRIQEGSPKPAASGQDLYLNADKLFFLAKQTALSLKLDNYAIPLCLTVEAEAYDAKIDYSAAFCELKIKEYPFTKLTDIFSYKSKKPPRQSLVLQVISRLKRDKSLPVIGQITAPLTLLSQLLSPDVVLKGMLKDKQALHRAIQKVLPVIKTYGKEQINAGADAIIIGEPMANDEILGADLFSQFCKPYLGDLINYFENFIPGGVILHICGRLDSLTCELASLPPCAFSVDTTCNIDKLKQQINDRDIIMSVCTHSLAGKKPDEIINLTLGIIKKNFTLISIPCGLLPKTPLENLQALYKATLKTKS